MKSGRISPQPLAGSRGLWQNRSRSSASVKKIPGKHIEELKAKIEELNFMVDTLEHLAKHRHGDYRPDCPILDDLSSATNGKQKLLAQNLTPKAGCAGGRPRERDDGRLCVSDGKRVG
jgi:hypothetical protein